MPENKKWATPSVSRKRKTERNHFCVIPELSTLFNISHYCTPHTRDNSTARMKNSFKSYLWLFNIDLTWTQAYPHCPGQEKDIFHFLWLAKVTLPSPEAIRCYGNKCVWS